MKMKFLLTASALAVGFFLGTQTGQASASRSSDPNEHGSISSGFIGTSNGSISSNSKKRPLFEYLAEEEGADQRPSKKSRTDGDQGTNMESQVEEWRATLKSLSKKHDPNEGEVDKILKYLQDAQQVTANDYRLAAHAHYRSSENPERVIDLYKQVLPNEMEFHDYTRLAYSYYLLDNFETAAHVYDLAFFQVKNTRDYEGICEAFKGMYDDPEEMYEDLSDAAWANYKSGRYRIAANIFDEILGNFPDLLIGYDSDIDSIAEVYEKAGNVLYAKELRDHRKEMEEHAEKLRVEKKLNEEEE